MQAKERFLFFGIGALLGSVILAMTYKGKYQAVEKQKAMDALNGYTVASGIVPGQDLNARKPFDTGPALMTKDSEIAPDGTFTRILIAKGSGKESPLWRIEETLWKDPTSTREKLVRRRIMYADKIVVRLKEGSNDLDQLKQALHEFNMEVLGTGNGPRLYNINLPTHEVDTVPNAISTLTSKVQSIEAAFPFYNGKL